MLKTVISSLLITIATVTMGQTLDTLRQDTIRKVPKNLLGVFVDVGSSVVPGVNSLKQETFFGGGIRYNRLEVAFHANQLATEVTEFVVFPNISELDYRYGDFRISYHLRKDQDLQLTPSVSYALGDIVWKQTDDGEIRFRDTWDIVRLSLGASYRAHQFFYPYAFVGYQSVDKPDIPAIEDEFSGFYLQIGAKLGFFSK